MVREKLPRCLEIRNKKLRNCLNNVKEGAKELWDRPLLRHYTNHGVDHSNRIIERIGDLLEDRWRLLNDHERFILLAAVYLHDIGMQSPKHAGLDHDPNKEYTLEELEKIREVHHESSAKMIKESVSRESNLTLGLELCRDYVEFIAIVSKYHRKLDIKGLKDTAFAGKKIKLPLLVTLLRLGDKLDADFNRVNMKILKLQDIPIKSKLHWWLHHYVQSVFIEDGKIKLYFRFPEVYRKDMITQVIRRKMYESIQNQYTESYDILYNYNIRLHRAPTIEEDSYTGDVEPLPDDLLDHMKKNIMKEKKEPFERNIDLYWEKKEKEEKKIEKKEEEKIEEAIKNDEERRVKLLWGSYMKKLDKFLERLEKGSSDKCFEYYREYEKLDMFYSQFIFNFGIYLDETDKDKASKRLGYCSTLIKDILGEL